MSEIEKHSLTIHTGNGLARVGLQCGKIVTKMVEEVLSLSRDALTMSQKGELTKKFKIGDYEWCEPDYRQIFQWAESLNMEPLEVIKRMTRNVPSRLKGGRIINLYWDFSRLPLQPFELNSDLIIEHLFLCLWEQGDDEWNLSLRQPSLKGLYCNRSHLRKLDLTHLPQLTKLSYSSSKLCILDLSHVPRLMELACNFNLLDTLELYHVPQLRKLMCMRNCLTELKLIHVPQLTKLNCSGNKLTNLELLHVPHLSELGCGGNSITDLDLSHTPQLTKLNCYSNKLASLDLSKVSQLTELDCQSNDLTELDLSDVPMLTVLDCGENQLTDLDIRPLVHLKELTYDYDKTNLTQRHDQNF